MFTGRPREAAAGQVRVILRSRLGFRNRSKLTQSDFRFKYGANTDGLTEAELKVFPLLSLYTPGIEFEGAN